MLKFVELVKPKILGKSDPSEEKKRNSQKAKVSFSHFLLRPVTLATFMLILMVIISFTFGMLATKTVSLLGFGDRTFRISNSSRLTPTPDGLLRSNAALIQGEIKEVKEDSLVVFSGEEKVEVKFSKNYSRTGQPSVATSSSGLPTPLVMTLPNLKVGDKVELGVQVENGKTVVTSVYVKESSTE